MNQSLSYTGTALVVTGTVVNIEHIFLTPTGEDRVFVQSVSARALADRTEEPSLDSAVTVLERVEDLARAIDKVDADGTARLCVESLRRDATARVETALQRLVNTHAACIQSLADNLKVGTYRYVGPHQIEVAAGTPIVVQDFLDETGKTVSIWRARAA